MADVEKDRRARDVNELDDEMLPNEGEPVPQQETGGETRDTAGEHGRMAVETAETLRKAEEKKRTGGT